MNGTNNLNTNVPANSEYVFRTNAFTVNGDEFDPNLDIWDMASIKGKPNFDILRPVATDQFIFNAKKTIKVELEVGNPNTAVTMLRRFNKIVEAIDKKKINIIEEAELTAYLMRNNNLQYLSFMRILANKSHAIKAPLFTDEARSFVNNIKLAKTKDHGAAIRSWDPEFGAMRPAEDQAVANAINDAFNDGELSLRSYLGIRMFRGLGMRPQSLAYMKVCDIRDTAQGMSIRIPKAKQKGQGARTDFMAWKPVTEGLARILRLYINTEIIPRFGNDIENVPLFFYNDVRSDRNLTPVYKAICSQMLYQKSTVKTLAIGHNKSDNGRRTCTNANRERYTFATIGDEWCHG